MPGADPYMYGSDAGPHAALRGARMRAPNDGAHVRRRRLAHVPTGKHQFNASICDDRDRPLRERSTMPDYAPGTPSWIELSSPDTDAAAQFYGELMGWSATEPGSEETGGYRMFQLHDKNIAGLMGHMQEGQPTAWATYVSVADADETAGKVRAAGGSVVLEPMDVMDIGRMALFADPTGAVFGVWQPKSFTGADLVNEPGSLCWNEVLTRDADAARRSTRRSSAGRGVPPRSRARRRRTRFGSWTENRSGA